MIDLMVATLAAFIGGLLVARLAGPLPCCHPSTASPEVSATDPTAPGERPPRP